MTDNVKKPIDAPKPSKAEDVFWFYEMLSKPWKVLLFNFSMGLFRGLGFALGITVFAGIILALMYKAMAEAVNLPLVGEYLGKGIEAIKEQIDVIEQTRRP